MYQIASLNSNLGQWKSCVCKQTHLSVKSRRITLETMTRLKLIIFNILHLSLRFIKPRSAGSVRTLRYGKQLQIIFPACRNKVRSFLLILKHISYPGRSSVLNGVILCCYNYSMPRKEVIIIKAFIFTFYGFAGVIIHARCWENTRKAWKRLY